MFELIYSERALQDIERLADFLLDTAPAEAQATAGLIIEALQLLTHHPEIGRKVQDGQRELVISRGRTGYLALYRLLPALQRVLVLAIRHQREVGYTSN
jgi:plasmid stabilization system protein ParE